MTRKECLEQAMGCVLRDRNVEYGEPEQSFHYIADLWSAYLRTKIETYDAAAMMALFKLARLRFNPFYEDGWTDLAGYAACGAELAGAEKAREDATRRAGEEYKKLRAEAEGNAKAEDCEEPGFKPGDSLLLTMPDGEDVKSADVVVLWKHKPNAESCEYKKGDKVQVATSEEAKEWHDATYVSFCQMSRDLWRHEVEYADGGRRYVPREWIRPMPKAEGVEDLVQKDAPQTAQELYDRILSCNPATYGRTRKPTGEELAEMAEEETNV